MNKVIRIIGALILAILVVSVPVIFGISLTTNLPTYISISVGMIVVGEIAVVCIWFYFMAEDE